MSPTNGNGLTMRWWVGITITLMLTCLAAMWAIVASHANEPAHREAGLAIKAAEVKQEHIVTQVGANGNDIRTLTQEVTEYAKRVDKVITILEERYSREPN